MKNDQIENLWKKTYMRKIDRDQFRLEVERLINQALTDYQERIKNI